MKYAGTLPIMDPPRADTAETVARTPTPTLTLNRTRTLLLTRAAGYPFYYRALREWEHYVPLRPDLSDLPGEG